MLADEVQDAIVVVVTEILLALLLRMNNLR